MASARQIKSKIIAQNNRIAQLQGDYYLFDIQWHKMLSHAMACISMFLIGAPLGAIIKRGGLGFPVLVSVLFFIIYYVISIGGEKYAKGGDVSVIGGVLHRSCLNAPSNRRILQVLSSSDLIYYQFEAGNEVSSAIF